MDAAETNLPWLAMSLDHRRPVEREAVNFSSLKARLQRFEPLRVSKATFRFVDRQKPEELNVMPLNPAILQGRSKRIRKAEQEMVE